MVWATKFLLLIDIWLFSGNRGRMATAKYDFRGPVPSCGNIITHSLLRIRRAWGITREYEVANLELTLLVEQDIRLFQVPV